MIVENLEIKGFILIFNLWVIFQRRQARNQNRNLEAELMPRPCRGAAYCILLKACSSCFLITPRIICPGVVSPHCDRPSKFSNQLRKHPTNLPLCLFSVGIFFFPDDYILWQVNKKTTQSLYLFLKTCTFFSFSLIICFGQGWRHIYWIIFTNNIK